MLAKTIDSYGGCQVDAEPVADPTSELSAALDNRRKEDVAQMTRVTDRVRVKFATSAAAAPVSITPHTDGRTVWGSGASFDPTISKTATGTYLISYGTSYDDSLVGTTSNAVSETETVNLTFSHGCVKGSTFGTVQTDELNNTITVYVFNGANPPVLSDLGGGVTVEVVAA